MPRVAQLHGDATYTGKGPMFCSRHPEILHIWTRDPAFSFCTDPVNYVGLSWGGETQVLIRASSDRAGSKAQASLLSIPFSDIKWFIPGSPGKCEFSCFAVPQALHLFLSHGICHIRQEFVYMCVVLFLILSPHQTVNSMRSCLVSARLKQCLAVCSTHS